jgi:hypothetical protein
MRRRMKLSAGFAGLVWMALATPSLAGAWKFEVDSRSAPLLTYAENGKTKFFLGCGRALGLHVKYPGPAKKDGKASITIVSAGASMVLDGQFEVPPGDDTATDFQQWDLGYSRQDPEVYGTRWKVLFAQLLDLLGSGQPLTVSAGTDSYQLPAIDAANWRAEFDDCR